MDYIPQTPPSQPAPQPTYELKKDVTGNPPEPRGPQMMIAMTQDENGNQQKVQFRVPYPPKKNCKKCYGRGYIGFNTQTGNVIGCLKCYPLPR